MRDPTANVAGPTITNIIMTQDLTTYQNSLAQLLQQGAWVYDQDLGTLTQEEYTRLLNQVEPQNYELAYQMDNGLNILEKLRIERNQQNTVDAMVYERTWRELGLRVFEYEITTPPRLVVVGASEPEAGRTITLSWWVNATGQVLHYRAMYDDTVLFSEGVLK